jgi:hypothetical protein
MATNAPPPAGPAASNELSAKTALIASGLAFITCCFPVGIIGIALGVSARKKLAAVGRTTAPATVAIVLGVLSVLDFTGVFIKYRLDQKARGEQASGAAARAAEGRAKAELSADTACALAESWLLQHETSIPEPVTCKGKLSAGANVARLDGVQLGTKETYTVCFGRKTRWFALGVDLLGECPESVPEATAEGDETAQEEAMAKAAQQALLKKGIAKFQAHLALVAKAVDAREPKEQACPKLSKASAAIVDFTSLPLEGKPAKAEEGWGFLTSDELTTALDEKEDAKDRAEAVQKAMKAMTPYVLVLSYEDRALPKEVDSDTFDQGFFDGWLTVVDAKSSTVLCETKLDFESSKSIETHKVGLKIGPKVTLGGDLGADFIKQFNKALRAALQKATAGQVDVEY